MNEPLIPLINDYLAYTARGCELLRSVLGIEGNIIEAWLSRNELLRKHLCDESPQQPAIPGRGVLDSERKIVYQFHGLGCRVKFERIVVDFDFGPGGRHDGFDAWRLHQFAQSWKRYRALADIDEIQRELDSMEQKGEIVRLNRSLTRHLYFFRSAVDEELLRNLG
jgi:hypothetical protein